MEVFVKSQVTRFWFRETKTNYKRTNFEQQTRQPCLVSSDARGSLHGDDATNAIFFRNGVSLAQNFNVT